MRVYKIYKINKFQMIITHNKIVNIKNNRFIRSQMIIPKCFLIKKEMNYGLITYHINRIHKDKRN